ATVLAAREAPATARARHVERSAAFGDPEAIAVLADAAYAANARAPATAAAWFRAALRLLPAGQAHDRRLELTLAMAVALGSAGTQPWRWRTTEWRTSTPRERPRPWRVLLRTSSRTSIGRCG